jgi:hypothetical protein
LRALLKRREAGGGGEVSAPLRFSLGQFLIGANGGERGKCYTGRGSLRAAGPCTHLIVWFGNDFTSEYMLSKCCTFSTAGFPCTFRWWSLLPDTV